MQTVWVKRLVRILRLIPSDAAMNLHARALCDRFVLHILAYTPQHGHGAVPVIVYQLPFVVLYGRNAVPYLDLERPLVTRENLVRLAPEECVLHRFPIRQRVRAAPESDQSGFFTTENCLLVNKRKRRR